MSRRKFGALGETRTLIFSLRRRKHILYATRAMNYGMLLLYSLLTSQITSLYFFFLSLKQNTLASEPMGIPPLIGSLISNSGLLPKIDSRIKLITLSIFLLVFLIILLKKLALPKGLEPPTFRVEI